jgi:hypothetical protein
MSHLFSTFAYSSFSRSDEFEKTERLPVMKAQNAAVIGEYFPIPYNDIARVRIQKYLESSWSIQDIITRNVELTLDEKNHILYLLLSIDAYYRQKIYVMKRSVLLPLLMTEKGLKTLKYIKLKSFLNSNQGLLCDKPSWYDSTPSYPIYDIGEVFNFNYGMFWEAEDTKDYLLSQEPVKTDKDIVKLFRAITNEVIGNSSEFEVVPPLEILLRISSSMALENGKSVPHFSAKSNHLHFSNLRSAGKRVLITTGPGQGRDAVINKVEDLNTIQLINENIRNFLRKNFRDFLLIGTAEETRRSFFKRCMKYTSYFCRDIKKEGITKPKYLCKIILEALNKRFPKVSAFEYFNFYSGPWFEGDKGERGHGLGMANELTTLLQILIFYTVNRYLGIEGYYVNASSAYYLNDDAVTFINATYDDLEDYVNADFSVCEGLGIIPQKDKSFISQQCCIFCEIYFSRGKPFVNDKESYTLRESNIMSKCSNILEAKFYAGNMKGSLSDIENLLKKTYIYLGYEFSKEEINWPITLGGLRPFKLRGTDFTLKYVEQDQKIETLWKAYCANQESRLWSWNKFIKNYSPPIIKLFPSTLSEKDERVLDKLTITSNSNLSSLFFRPTKEHKFFRSVRKLYKKRQRVFNSTNTFPTFEIFCEEYSSKSTSNVFLCDSFIERFIKVRFFIKDDFKDPYLISNPITSYLNKFSNVDINSPTTSWGLFQTNNIISAEKSVFARSRTLNTLSLIDRFEEDLDVSILVFPEDPNDLEDFMESYPKPFLTYELVKNGNLLPIPKNKFRNPDLKLRKEVFGKYLNYREMMLSQTRTWLEMTYILKFEKAIGSFYDFEDDFWDVVDQQLKESKKTEESSESKISSSSSSDDDPFKYPIRLDTEGVEVIYTKPSYEEVVVENDDEPEPIIGNQFMKTNPLPEGDISVYGSEEWIRWFVNQDTDVMEEYVALDENLAHASVDVMNFRQTYVASVLFNDRTEMLKSNIRGSADESWIAHFYVLEIFEGVVKEDDPIEINLFE